MLAGCQAPVDDPRAATLVSVLARADAALIRARPGLVAGKYARMAKDPYGFYRGALPVFRHDWEQGALGQSAYGLEPAWGLGDPHPENFGLLVDSAGTLALEPNDFDAADVAPPLWDLRRLAAGMSLAARLSNPDEPAARAATAATSRAVAAAVAEAYAEAVVALSSGATPVRVTDPGTDLVLADLWDRAARDAQARSELDATELHDGQRRFRRGPLKADNPAQALADAPAAVLAALPEALARYRETLLRPPPPEFFRLLDAARLFGAGVASWPKVRLWLLVRGPSDAPDDDLVLELKELGDAELTPVQAPGVFADDAPARVLFVAHRAWAVPEAEPLWGTSRLLGLDCQIKREAGAQKTVRLARLSGERGTAVALRPLGRTLGALLGRVHAAHGTAARLAPALRGTVEAFVDEQADVAEQLADQTLADHARFRDALAELGPSLGVPLDLADAPPPDLAALYGTPPEASP